MKIIHHVAEAQSIVAAARASGKTVGLVPTMGALHDGHVSLVRESVRRCDQTFVSIFVNPTQFAPHEDLDKYPRTLDADCAAVQSVGADYVFAPEVGEMYPAGFSTAVDPPAVAVPLEGVCRPDHFRGVATVVLKLFQCVPATHAIFGSKDYQQWKVIEAMVRDLNIGIQIVAGETIRDPDGLAMSSRNRYLSSDQRRIALSLSAALRQAKQMASDGETSVDAIESAMREQLAETTRIDYARVVDAQSLETMTQIDRPVVALVAAFVGQTRLIDNQRIG
ncbi:Pantoate-beta-alanine ligase [Rubripirellula lacrimiformis]|uniref:Pantothenate synthetase n=1 Tax=Rubripirellula lacrimiformis TaxID=1930273 RepID=A0A517NDQ4_9BACT|nr:pantoate--beta-alanine ligase [Rubripirellula lacrimiformis]QDT05252.1 Pantoate-beta-alanine ligase [Rubripirellula lacrimiformis]